MRSVLLRLVLAALAAAGSALAQEPPPPPSPALHMRFETARTAYALDEPIPVQAVITNPGGEAVDFEYEGETSGPRSGSFQFRATHLVSGARASDPFPPSNGGSIPVYSEPLAPGASWSTEVDLRRYLTFPEAGMYEVTGEYDLGRPSSGAACPTPTATLRIEILSIPPEAAERRVAALDAENDDRGFRILGHPIYLEPLLARLRPVAEGGEERAPRAEEPKRLDRLLAGIDSIRTAAATEALIALADDPRAAVRRTAHWRLKLRLPQPIWDDALDVAGWTDPGPIFTDVLRARLRDLCVRQVTSADIGTAGAAALTLAYLHETGMLAFLLDKADRFLAPDAAADEHDGAGSADYGEAIYALVRLQGVALPPLGEKPSRGRLMLWAQSLPDRHAEWPPGTGERLAGMLHGSDRGLRGSAVMHLVGLAALHPEEIPWKELLLHSDPVFRQRARDAAYANMTPEILAIAREALAETLRTPALQWTKASVSVLQGLVEHGEKKLDGAPGGDGR